MRQFHIYHSTGLDRFTEVENQPRAYAGYVIANSLEMAYSKSQNGDWPWNLLNPCRSTSVGDVIQNGDEFHMVSGIGFTLLVEPTECDNIDGTLYYE